MEYLSLNNESVGTVQNLTVLGGLSMNDSHITEVGNINGVSIENLESLVGTVETDVATNTSNISTNTSNISTNTVNISANTSTLSNQLALINANSAGITANAGSISTNASDISSIGSRNAVDGYAGLDSNAKLPTSVFPLTAIVQVFTASSQVDMLALTTEEGDVVVRTDESKSYMRNSGVVGDMTDFTLLMTPPDSVTSVNAQTGTVSLVTGDIPESSNLYYTDARVESYLDGGTSTPTFASLTVTGNQIIEGNITHEDNVYIHHSNPTVKFKPDADTETGYIKFNNTSDDEKGSITFDYNTNKLSLTADSTYFNGVNHFEDATSNFFGNALDSTDYSSGGIQICKDATSAIWLSMVREGNYIWGIGTDYNTNNFAIHKSVSTTESSNTSPVMSIDTAGACTIPGDVSTGPLTVSNDDATNGNGISYDMALMKARWLNSSSSLSDAVRLEAYKPVNGTASFQFRVKTAKTGVGLSDALVVSEDQYLGVAVDPSYPLHVKNTANGYKGMFTDGTRSIGIYTNSGSQYCGIGTFSNNDLEFWTNNGSTQMTLTTGGDMTCTGYALQSDACTACIYNGSKAGLSCTTSGTLIFITDGSGWSSNMTADPTNSRITITQAGYYKLSLHYCGSSSGSPGVELRFHKNGTDINSNIGTIVTNQAGYSLTYVTSLAVSDYIQVYGYGQGSTKTLNTQRLQLVVENV